jgi:thiol-disulfide isomerase/thioredoxin
VPCREEIPALDQLEQKLGNNNFEVVTLNIDTAKLERRAAFFADAGVKKLSLYADPSANVFQILRREGKVLGLPTTFLLSPDLCHIGTMQGGGNWASDEALDLIKTALR